MRIFAGGGEPQSDICASIPAWRGAGYAGGIMSAAVDGILTAERYFE